MFTRFTQRPINANFGVNNFDWNFEISQLELGISIWNFQGHSDSMSSTSSWSFKWFQIESEEISSIYNSNFCVLHDLHRDPPMKYFGVNNFFSISHLFHLPLRMNIQNFHRSSDSMSSTSRWRFKWMSFDLNELWSLYNSQI